MTDEETMDAKPAACKPWCPGPDVKPGHTPSWPEKPAAGDPHRCWWYCTDPSCAETHHFEGDQCSRPVTP